MAKLTRNSNCWC